MSRKKQSHGRGCSLIRCIIFVMALIPAMVTLATLYQHKQTFGNHPDSHAEALIQEPFQRSHTKIDTAEVKEEDLDGMQSSTKRKEPVPAYPDPDHEPNTDDFYLNSEHPFHEKQKFIGSNPMDGNWMLDCPEQPPPGYPKQYPIMDLIDNWNPDKPVPVPPKHYHALCRFDYRRDLKKAIAYRNAEVPFILYNNPQAEKVVTNWAIPGYLEKLTGKERFNSEISHNNHFMYHSNGGAKANGKAWVAPTGKEKFTFEAFKKFALECQARNCSTEEKHVYFRITAPKMGHFMFNELPFFQPNKGSNVFLKDPKGQRGIHCRFGMPAVIAENHYDGSRNIIGLFGGRRRYILSHPNQCQNMYLLPMGHPSGRHSGDACNFDPKCKDSPTSVDYSNPDLERFPKFKDLQANEVILSPGDFLYLPTHWFHYIISLELNYQCNTRSGRENTYQPDVKKCGFR